MSMLRAKYILVTIILVSLLLSQCSQPTPFYQSINIQSTDGAVSYLEVDSLNTNYLTNGFTWEFWFQVSDVTIDAPCVLMVPDAYNNNDLAIFIDVVTGQTITLFFGNHQVSATSGVDLLDGGFHSLALANDATARRLTLFVDGSLRAAKSHNWQLNPTGRNILIGGDWDPGRTTPDNGWTGYLDEVRLWDTALPDDELIYHGRHIEKLTEHYNPDLLAHLKVLWRFNTENGSLGTVSDEHPGNGERPMLIPHGSYQWAENAVR